MSQPTPVIVVGMNRSGTKWLSNILCNHSELIGVQSQRHGGIIETNMFDVMSQKFDLDHADDYLAFIDLWTRSDFFRHTGVDKELFLEKPWSRDFLEIFTALMGEYAEQNGKGYWIQKASPECGLALVSRLTSAKFIVIERDFIDTIKSTLQLEDNKGGQPSVFESVYSTVAQTKMINRLLRQRDVLRVTYGQLRNQTQSVVQQVCDHVGLTYEPEMVESRFQKNTSFKGSKHASVDFVERHTTRLRLMRIAINMIPLAAMQAYSKWKATIVGAPPQHFVRGSFSELEDELSEPQSEPVAMSPVGSLD